MAVIKVLEIMSNSKKSWEDAVETGVKKASKSIKNIRSANVSNQSVVIEGSEIKEYRVSMKISFEVE